jgi:YHS domain-containing protein
MKRLTVSFLALVALASTFTLSAQDSAAIGGYCPVAYAATHKAVQGDQSHSSVYHGQRFLFVNAKAKTMFDANPDQYSPQYGGYCATAVAMGKKVKSNPTLFTVHDGKTYLFSTAEAKQMFDGAKSMTAAKADAQWPQVSKKPETSI